MKRTPRTSEEVQAEIAALEACKAWAPHYSGFGDDNHAKIDLQIEYLRGEIDMTADEWEDYTDDEQGSIMEAQGWEDGEIDEAPSAGWDSFKPKTAEKRKKGKK